MWVVTGRHDIPVRADAESRPAGCFKANKRHHAMYPCHEERARADDYGELIKVPHDFFQLKSFSSPYPTKWCRYNMFSTMLWLEIGKLLYDRPTASRQPSLGVLPAKILNNFFFLH
jgi:hypothetical protein